MKTTNNIPAYRFQGYTDAWEQRKLSEFVSFYNGLTYSPNDVNENGTLVLRSSNVKDGEVAVADNVYVDTETVTSENVKVGDIVVVVRNGSKALIGKHAVIKESMPNTVIGAFMSGIRTDIPFFVNALLDTKWFEKEIEKNMGATINQITGYMFSNMEFIIPSIAEQSAIGSFFSTLDRHIALHQRKLDTLKEQKKTYLKLLFPAKGQTKPALRFQGFEDDWEEVKLGEVCTIQGGNAWKSDSYSLTGEYLVVTIANVTGEYFIDDKKGNRIDINPNEMQYVLKKGDILISLTGNVGRVSKMTESKGVLNQRVGKLTTTANFEFIFSILRTEKFENEMRLASQGAAQANISNKDVLQYMIPLPSLPEQEVIGTFFQTLDQEIAQVEDKLDSLKEMKKTLLRKLFVSWGMRSYHALPMSRSPSGAFLDCLSSQAVRREFF